MTEKDAWMLGYDEAAKHDYESSQHYFLDIVLTSTEITPPDNLMPSFRAGIKANWEDCVSNGAVYEEE